MKKVATKNAPEAIGPYSQAIICNGFLFSSGQIALKPDGSFVNGDISEQTRQVMSNLEGVLGSVGLKFDDVVKTTIFLTNLENFALVNEIYATYFKSNLPARSTIGVSSLPKGALIEIEVVARVNDF